MARGNTLPPDIFRKMEDLEARLRRVERSPAQTSATRGIAVYRTSDQSIANTTSTVIGWNVTWWASNDYTLSSGRVRVGRPGYHLIYSRVLFSPGEGRRHLNITYNGSTRSYTNDNSPIDYGPFWRMTLQNTLIYWADEGSYIDTQVWHNAGTALTAYGTAAYSYCNVLSVVRLGGDLEWGDADL